MTILQKLILEISQAIGTYQAEKQKNQNTLSDIRKQNLVDICQILKDCEAEGSAYRLRKTLIKYIQRMPSNWLADKLSVFDTSLLRKLIHEILEKSEFSENELLAQEAIELRQRQQLIGTAEDNDDLLAKLDAITEELQKKTQQAQLAMGSSEQYQKVCADLGKQCQGLIDKNRQLQQELYELQSSLTKQLDELKTKVREQSQLIDKLNVENRQLRLDKDAERTRSLKIQKKLDDVTPQYAASLETIKQLKSLLKKHGINETELQTLQKDSEIGLAESSMEMSLEAC